MSEPFLSQPSSPADWERYFDLRWRVLREPWEQPRGSERDSLDDNCMHVMLCDQDRYPLAIGRLHFPTPDVGQVRYMAVDPAFRRKGFGRQVLAGLERLAEAAGALRIRLNARENAVPFYESQGYRIVAPGELLFGAIVHQVMEKQLAVLP